MYYETEIVICSATSRKKLRKKSVSKKRGVSEGGEETDEGDMESWEVDYMSESSSASEKEYKVGVVLVT